MGVVEVFVSGIIVLNSVKGNLFFFVLVYDEENICEELWLCYCYLDLCCKCMNDNLWLWVQIIQVVCCFLEDVGFIEVEILVLICFILEGVCDYVLFSWVCGGEWFVLFQFFQLFKQLLMVGGIEWYYQVVCCFCDEDLWVDCQLEFIQLDIEMSFMDQEQILELNELLICVIWKVVKGIELLWFFLCMIWYDVMECYGID